MSSPNQPALLSASLHVNDARAAIAQLVETLLAETKHSNSSDDVITVPLDQAINRILAEDLLSPINVPAADNSAMDGYAFSGEYLALPDDDVCLQVVGTAYAGKPYGASFTQENASRS